MTSPTPNSPMVPGPSVEGSVRPCTCHPADAPPTCQYRYALNECLLAASEQRSTAYPWVKCAGGDWELRDDEGFLYRAARSYDGDGLCRWVIAWCCEIGSTLHLTVGGTYRTDAHAKAAIENIATFEPTPEKGAQTRVPRDGATEQESLRLTATLSHPAGVENNHQREG